MKKLNIFKKKTYIFYKLTRIFQFFAELVKYKKFCHLSEVSILSVINCEEVKRDEFHTEKYYESYNIFGAHIVTEDEMRGVRFTVWAPHAKAMSVVGDFNEWDYEQHKMLQVTEEGIWSLFIPHIEEREIYKYAIETMAGDVIFKADPYAVYAEVRPNTASVVFDIKGYEWNDKNWSRKKRKIGL